MWDKVKGSRRKLYKAELRGFYSSPNMAGHQIKDKMKGEGGINILVGKPGGKRKLGSHWRSWEDINKVDLKRNRMGGPRLASYGSC
jgi:hypothetical protein